MNFKILIYPVCLISFISCAKQHNRPPETSIKNITPPVLQTKINPEYPDKARSLGIEGRVELSLLVSKTGNVEHAVVTGSSGSEELDAAAQEYGKRLKFTPAIKDEKKVNVWLTWVVNYNILNQHTLFNTTDYINRIKSLIDLTKGTSGEEKEKLLNEILTTHKQYFLFISDNPQVNLNSQLKSILSRKIIEQWQEYWNQWPLTFVVLQDFDLRFPDTNLKSFAIDLLINQVVEDLHRISQSEYDNKNKFYKDVYTFLIAQYPKTLENSRKEDLQRYLDY